MESDIDALSARVARLERSNRGLKAALLGLVFLGIGCGATTTVANYGTVRTHTLEVFTPSEDGHLVKLGRDAKGGRLELKTVDGKVAVVIDAGGVHTQTPPAAP